MSFITTYLRDLLSDAIYLVPAILVALSAHEWAHAFAAYKLGDPTARAMGRMTLNPLRHIDPMGLVFLLLFRFGWAKPVPINPRNFNRPRRDEIIVSLAGVVLNFLLAFVTMGVQLFCLFKLNVNNVILMNFLSVFYSLNLGLCIFNLIPIYPLDGFHVLECLLIRKVGPNFFIWMERYGSFILIALVLTRLLTGIMSFAISGVSGGILAFYSLLFRIA
ncbi:MAG: site-2 protease family protein [Eubacteriales bacterium]|nr:site-2 protease family protein [Eubacteriales bacterium]